MAEAQAEEPCPFCGRHVSPTAQDCPHCGEALFEDEEEREPQPRRGRAEPTVQPTEFLLPTDVSGYSIAACYFGLLGFCFPVVGLVLAIPAFICGIVALRQRKKRSSYGSVTSDIRAVIGLIFSSLAILIWGGVLIAILVAEARR